MLCHEAGQIDSRQVARHKGVQAQVQGRTMDCFEIQQ
jgi:hypothetical protein